MLEKSRHLLKAKSLVWETAGPELYRGR